MGGELDKKGFLAPKSYTLLQDFVRQEFCKHQFNQQLEVVVS